MDKDEGKSTNPKVGSGYYDCYSKMDSNWKQKTHAAIRKIKSVF